jgi:hypothetical protein
MIANFSDFCRFSEKKWRFSWKPTLCQRYDYLFPQNRYLRAAVILILKKQIFSPIFWQKYLQNQKIVMGSMLSSQKKLKT